MYSTFLFRLVLVSVISSGGMAAQSKTVSVAPKVYDFSLKRGPYKWKVVALEKPHTRKAKAYSLGLRLERISRKHSSGVVSFFRNGHFVKKIVFKLGEMKEFKVRKAGRFGLIIRSIEEDEVAGRLVLPPRLRGDWGGCPTNGEKVLKLEDRDEQHVSEPVLEKQTQPNYTDEALNAGITGKVLIQFVIRKDGSTDCFKVMNSLGFGLDEAVVQEVARKWIFRPATKDGQAIDIEVMVETTFVFGRSAAGASPPGRS